MNPASEDIKDRLTDSAHNVGTFGTDLFIGIMPDGAGLDQCISLRDSSSVPPELNYTLEDSTVQALIRSPKGGYRTAEAKAREIYDALHGVTNTTINGTRYLLIRAAHTPIFIGNDEDNRPLFSINFEVKRTPA